MGLGLGLGIGLGLVLGLGLVRLFVAGSLICRHSRPSLVPTWVRGRVRVRARARASEGWG